MATVKEQFGSLVFDDRVMKASLDAKVYASLKKTIDEGKELDLTVANAVAAAMKDWAVAHGATHYTHWFHHSVIKDQTSELFFYRCHNIFLLCKLF